MLNLQTFGALRLHGPHASGADALLAQPRSTALLVYLVLAQPRDYVSRDTLCLLFWPESDEEHARGALSQALSRIRRYVGPDILESRGKNEVRIAPGSVACDILAFEEAVAAGDHRTALDLCGGPFLAGFHAPHAPGFEEWAEIERERLRRLAVEAARDHARRLIEGNRLPEAARAASRALAMAPESEAVAAELVRALAEAGDRPGALHLYDFWAGILAQEMELEPGEDTQAAAADLRQDGGGPGHHAAPPARDEARLGAAEMADPPPGEAAEPASLPRRRGRTSWLAVQAAVVLPLVTWGVARMVLPSDAFPVKASGRALAGLEGNDWLLVADVQAPSVDPGLALAFQTLLARDLESAGYVGVVGGMGAMRRRGLEDVLARMRLPPDTPVDPGLACEMAEREGAAGVLSSRVLPLGRDYVLEASVLGGATCEEVIRATAVAPFDSLSGAVEAISRELRTRLGESRASIRSSPPLPPITTSYVEALRAVARYLESPELWGDEAAGAAVLEDAIRIEPDFAFAHFALALHYQGLGRFERALPHFRQAWAARSSLPLQGQLGMEAIHQRYLASDPRSAMVTVGILISQYPAMDDVTLPFLADAAAWVGDWEKSLDVSLEHLRRGPAGLSAHLSRERAWRAAWGLERVALADSLFRAIQAAERAEGLEPDRRTALLHRLLHGDWAGAEAYCAESPQLDRCGYLYLARGKLAQADRAFRAALASQDGGVQPLDRAAAAAALVHLESSRGRADAAWALLQEFGRWWGAGRTPAVHITRFLICGSAATLGRSWELPRCSIEDEDRQAWDTDPSFTVLLRTGAWSRRLLAVRALEGGNANLTLEEAREAVRSNFGNPGLLDHLILGRAFDLLSQPDSALLHYREATRTWTDCCFPTAAGIAVPLAPVLRRMGELSERVGDRSSARRHYRDFVELWAEADPELQPQVEEVRMRLTGLDPAGDPNP